MTPHPARTLAVSALAGALVFGALALAAATAHAQPGQAVRTALQLHGGQQGRTWDDTNDNTLAPGWLIQTPIRTTWNQPYTNLANEPGKCVAGTPGCDAQFPRLDCTANANACTTANAGTCMPLQASRSTFGAAARSMCVGPADVALLDNIWDIVAHTTSLVDVVGLHNPKGEYLIAVHNALLAVDAANPGPVGPAAPAITVRVFYADYLQGGIDLPTTIIAALQAGLSPQSRIRLHVAATTYSRTSWNHAKIVVRDGHDALIGGHNFYPDHYLEKRGVHDVSLRLRGGAARHAQQFADALWTSACATTSLTNGVRVKSYEWGSWVLGAVGVAPAVAATPTARAPACPNGGVGGGLALANPAGGGGNVRAYSVGRLGMADPANQQADQALLALMDGATQSLRIAQQNLIWGPVPSWSSPWGDAVTRSVARAVLRGVRVEIVVSNYGWFGTNTKAENLAGDNNTDYPANTPKQIVEAIRKQMSQQAQAQAWSLPLPPAIQPPGPALFAPLLAVAAVINVNHRQPSDKEIELMLADRLRIAPLRMSATWDTYPGSNWGKPSLHSKLVVADDTAFYIGSQNLYQCDLSEFGVIIDDAGAAQTLLTDLWQPMWHASYHAVEPL